MNGDSVLLKLLAPKVDKALSNAHTVKELDRAVASYMDRNVMKLTTVGPVHRTVFLDDEIRKFFDILGIGMDEVRDILKESKYIHSQWQIMNNPFNSTAAFAIRYFKMKKNKHMQDAMIIYLTLSMYPSLHHKYFKYEPNENIMNYTIDNLSNKFKVKTSKNIFEALVDTTMVSDNTMSKRLIRGTDKDITEYVQAYKTRLNSMIKKIANVFYENQKKGLYLNMDSESNDPDDFRVADNDTQLTERLSDSVAMKLAVSGPNMKIVEISAKLSDISVNELRNTVNQLCDDQRNREEIKFLASAIIYLYICDEKNSKDKIGTNDFILYCLTVYKRANTTDENISKIKKILDSWLNKYSATYRRSNRVATLNDFRRALFTFVVYTIQQSTK